MTPRPAFPHMMPEDVPVWERWLAKHGTQYDTFLYDIRVGNGIEPPPIGDPSHRSMWADLTKKRIDVIARTLTTDLIIEVKDKIGFTALGQILAYPVLYEISPGQDRDVQILLVAAEILPDMQTVLETLRVPYEIV